MSELIHQALIAVMRDVDGLTKDRTSQQNFKYRGIDDVYNYLHDIQARHGIVTIPRVVGMKREERQSNAGKTLMYTIIHMEYDFMAEDGSKVTLGPVLGEAMDSGDKSCNKAMAIAHKYALFQLYMIPTNLSADPDSESHEVAHQPQPTLARKDQLKVIEDYRKLGGLGIVIENYLEERNGNLSEKQADQIITKLEKK